PLITVNGTKDPVRRVQVSRFPSLPGELVTSSHLMLILLFQHNSICWDGVLVERPGKVCAAPYLLICGRLAPGPETEQGLERGHGLPAPIVAKDEFIKINLKLITSHAVIGCDHQFLEIRKGAVC